MNTPTIPENPYAALGKSSEWQKAVVNAALIIMQAREAVGDPPAEPRKTNVTPPTQAKESD